MNVYIHDRATSFLFEIEGALSGDAVRDVEQSWRTACSVIDGRSLVIFIGDVSSIDPAGRALLRRWREAGAQFVAKSPLVKILVGSITGQRVISGTGAGKRGGWVWLRAVALPLIPLITLLFPATVYAASLEPTTLSAWEEYIQSASLRMEQRLGLGKNFLWVDEAPDRLARVRAGEIIVSPSGPQNPKRVHSGLVHDWVGAVFIPHATINNVLAVVGDYARYKEFYPPTVIASRVIATTETKDRFSMLLRNRSFFLKTALDTDYESCYVRLDDRHGYSVSRTTRIQEIEEYGSPAERVLNAGEGHGIIWQLFGVTRYVERDGGVYLELEAIGLSRDIPASLRWLIEPIVRRVSQGSLLTSLRQTENAVRAEFATRRTGSGTTAAAGRGGNTTQDLHAAHVSR